MKAEQEPEQQSEQEAGHETKPELKEREPKPEPDQDKNCEDTHGVSLETVSPRICALARSILIFSITSYDVDVKFNCAIWFIYRRGDSSSKPIHSVSEEALGGEVQGFVC